MKPDILDQIRDYLDGVKTPITVEEIETTPLVSQRLIAPTPRPLLAFVGTGLGILILGLGAVLGTGPPEPASPTQTAPTVTHGTPTECEQPPPSEVENVIQDFPIAISSNSVNPGDQVELLIAMPDGAAPESLAVGLTTGWQCWNGSEWVDAFLLAKGPEGSGLEPLVKAVDSEVIALGFYVPLRAAILIPDVPPGRYRLRERIHEDGGAAYEGCFATLP